MVFFVSLERVNVEDSVLPGETLGPERVLDRVSLGVVRGDDLEVLALLQVTPCNFDCGFDFTLVLSGKDNFSTRRDACSGGLCIPSNWHPS